MVNSLLKSKTKQKDPPLPTKTDNSETKQQKQKQACNDLVIPKAKEINSMSNVFPNNKIKASFLIDKRIGKVSADAIDLIGSTSTFFITNLIQTIITTNNNKINNNNIKISSSEMIALQTKDDENKNNKKTIITKITEPSSSSEKSQTQNIDSTTTTTSEQQPPILITLENIRECIKNNSKQYSFLSDTILTSIKEDECTTTKASKKRSVKSTSRATTQPNPKKKKAFINSQIIQHSNDENGIDATSKKVMDTTTIISNNEVLNCNDKCFTTDDATPTSILKDEEDYD